MRIVIVGHDPPGRSFCDPDGNPYGDVHVGLQVRTEPTGLVRGDADDARCELDVDVVHTDDGAVDFRGRAVHGRRGGRFIYLTWGNVGIDGSFDMFRRAKLMLGRIDPALLEQADRPGAGLEATVRLRDESGRPRCARVDPPDIDWAIEPG